MKHAPMVRVGACFRAVLDGSSSLQRVKDSSEMCVPDHHGTDAKAASGRSLVGMNVNRVERSCLALWDRGEQRIW